MKESNPEKKRPARLWLKIFAIIMASGAIFCMAGLFLLYRQYSRGTAEIAEVRDQVRLSQAEDASGTSETYEGPSDAAPSNAPVNSGASEEASEPVITCQQAIDFDAAHEINQDIYAWLTVPGTDVDHPVLQSETDDYYLMCNLDGSDGYPGCLYTNDSCTRKDFSNSITIIYGHDMPTNLMFTSLHNLEDKAVFDANETFTVYTEENRFTYELVAAVWYTDDYIPRYYSTTKSSGMLEFWNSIVTECDFVNEPSYIRDGTTITADDKLIVLSTCCRKNGRILQGRRYLVIGRLIETAVCE